jgi:four helix bundle protein
MPTPPTDFQTRSFLFACVIVRLYRMLISSCPSVLARQVLRSGTSIGANLEEAKAAQSRRDLAAKFSIALKEARETAYWLRLLASTEPNLREPITPRLEEANELVAILTASLKRLKPQK